MLFWKQQPISSHQGLATCKHDQLVKSVQTWWNETKPDVTKHIEIGSTERDFKNKVWLEEQSGPETIPEICHWKHWTLAYNIYNNFSKLYGRIGDWITTASTRRKPAKSEDKTQKSGETRMSKYYLLCWQGHPAGFIVESTMQHCCLLASQWFSHHAKTHRVSGLPLQMKKTAESTKDSTGGNTMHPSPFWLSTVVRDPMRGGRQQPHQSLDKGRKYKGGRKCHLMVAWSDPRMFKWSHSLLKSNSILAYISGSLVGRWDLMAFQEAMPTSTVAT